MTMGISHWRVWLVENQQVATDGDNFPTHSTWATGIDQSNDVNDNGSGSDSESSDIGGNDGDDDNDIEIQEYLNVTYRQPSKFIS